MSDRDNRLPPAPGSPAPDFTLPDPDGVPVTRSVYQGESPLLLYFFRGTW
jgi:peroxiredoxin